MEEGLSLEGKALKLITNQVNLIDKLQEIGMDAIAADDRNKAIAMVEAVQVAFLTLTEGLTKMKINVDPLKDVISKKSSGQPTDIKPLEERITATEDDIKAIKDAIEELNNAASGSSSTESTEESTPSTTSTKVVTPPPI